MSDISPTPQPPSKTLWEPTAGSVAASRVGPYLAWLATQGKSFPDYQSLWTWSVTELEEFWGSIWTYFEVHSRTPPGPVLASREMPGARWFPGASLNYAERCVGTIDDLDQTAIHAYSQTRDSHRLTFRDLRDQVARARAGLARLGVSSGDRVVAYLPNIPEAVVAFLATASLGAIWASCAPEFGSRGVIDRFAQLEPTILLAVTGYVYGDKTVDRRAAVDEIRQALPSLRATVQVPYVGDPHAGLIAWDELLSETGPLDFVHVPFDHPLFVLFSSGTTGVPKAIVHKHGGILLEHLKNHALSWDLGPGDVLQWFSTTAWMVWNAVVSGLLHRAAIVLVDGNPIHPDVGWQWRIAGECGTTTFGASPGYLTACRASGLHPAAVADLSSLRQIGVVGSALSPDGYIWLDEHLGPSVIINVGSGGTDVCTGIVTGGPFQTVRVGEIPGPALGVAAAAYSPDGRPIVNSVGELVITQPMPSMPLGFWGDESGARYFDAYFATFPGVWCHGDWIRFATDGSCTISGRSDATLNRGGVRLGTAEFYAVLEAFEEIDDSLVVHIEDPNGGAGSLIALVVLANGAMLDHGLKQRIGTALRTSLSPRHVPDQVFAVQSVPRNRTGKKLEIPVKRLLQGAALEDVVSIDAVADPVAFMDLVLLVDAIRSDADRSAR